MTIIKIENLSKKYVLRHQQRESYSALRDVISDKVKAVANRLIHPFAGHHLVRTNSTQEEFWALRDVSFDINRGERIGIIGRNGAGKSTLLKILSRITEPTKGQVAIKGRVASLLEVGTGFHPELTGRENIFLNGAILGMSRLEIKRKFDEIVAFAEIERFLDTPVKHYSSGMYVRLAFAVAAHMEPDILVIDEVLAVGDVQFQKKCMGKMEDVSVKEGRTVLFVSHNMQAIQRLCERAVWLEKGIYFLDGKSDEVVNSYLEKEDVAESIDSIKEMIFQLPHDPVIQVNDIALQQNKENTLNVMTGSPLDVLIQYEVFQKTVGLRLQILLYDLTGVPIFSSYAHPEDEELRTSATGKYTTCVTIPADFLAPVGYRLGIYASIYNVRNCFSSQGVFIKFHAHESGRIKFAYAHSGPISFKLAPLLSWKTVQEL